MLFSPCPLLWAGHLHPAWVRHKSNAQSSYFPASKRLRRVVSDYSILPGLWTSTWSQLEPQELDHNGLMGQWYILSCGPHMPYPFKKHKTQNWYHISQDHPSQWVPKSNVHKEKSLGLQRLPHSLAVQFTRVPTQRHCSKEDVVKASCCHWLAGGNLDSQGICSHSPAKQLSVWTGPLLICGSVDPRAQGSQAAFWIWSSHVVLPKWQAIKGHF